VDRAAGMDRERSYVADVGHVAHEPQ
jgi:hypothetical protein